MMDLGIWSCRVDESDRVSAKNLAKRGYDACKRINDMLGDIINGLTPEDIDNL
jgi:hypothetical protein